ncbi:hypothetical protein RJT34_13008 [Clitoria ternatea]|uniref:Uncharacterized protein n=1 Tax=Clitoria ternatea TaxID=43366 RepID=A0AAN9JQF2_CLITE
MSKGKGKRLEGPGFAQPKSGVQPDHLSDNNDSEGYCRDYCNIRRLAKSPGIPFTGIEKCHGTNTVVTPVGEDDGTENKRSLSGEAFCRQKLHIHCVYIPYTSISPYGRPKISYALLYSILIKHFVHFVWYSPP